MKEIKVLGPGCASCEGLAADVKTLVAELDIECEIEKITDINQMLTFGVMLTPALVVDGEVKVAGRRPAMDELKEMLA
jgi:small redox-active disulfide protein 2